MRLCNNLNRRALPHHAARAAPDVPLAGFGLAPVSFVGQTGANPGHSLIVQIAPSTLMIDEVTQTQQQPSEDPLACKVGGKSSGPGFECSSNKLPKPQTMITDITVGASISGWGAEKRSAGAGLPRYDRSSDSDP